MKFKVKRSKYTLSGRAKQQRANATSFKKNPNYSGKWHTCNVRIEHYDYLVKKYGSFQKAMEEVTTEKKIKKLKQGE